MEGPTINADASEIHERAAALASRDAFMQSLGIELVGASPGRLTVRMTVTGRHLSFNGTGHGGVTFTLADAAFGLLLNTHGRVGAAVHADIAFCAPVQAGDVLVAEAVEVALSRRVGTYRVDVRSEDRIIATFTGTAHRTDRPHG